MNQEQLKPSPRHDHVYAILRYETDAAADVPIDLRVTVTKIVTDGEFADEEVARLNELNKGKGCYYFFQVTRIEKNFIPSPPIPEPAHAGGESAVNKP